LGEIVGEVGHTRPVVVHLIVVIGRQQSALFICLRLANGRTGFGAGVTTCGVLNHQAQQTRTKAS
jgi:hypothetical protein